jgi:hypothetical protein
MTEEQIEIFSSKIANKIDKECMKFMCRDENKQQELVNICYELVFTCTEKMNIKRFTKMTMEEKAEWVSKILKGCGFPTHPQGALWGVLDK